MALDMSGPQEWNNKRHLCLPCSLTFISLFLSLTHFLWLSTLSLLLVYGQHFGGYIDHCLSLTLPSSHSGPLSVFVPYLRFSLALLNHV